MLACDFSYHSSGVVVLHYEEKTRSVSIAQAVLIPIGNNYSVGAGVSRFFDMLVSLLASLDVKLFIRERAVPVHFLDMDRLFRIAGASDVALWQVRETTFYDIAPTTAKKLVTGNGRATKDVVTKALTKYVGKYDYETNDISDAVAVGVSF